MDPERRYTEEEVSEILDRATEAQLTRTPTGGGGAGLTLAELKEIGQEVGIPEDVISSAAASLDRPRPAVIPQPKFLGQNIGVGRTVDLPRRLTDTEWNRLVIDLRETFNAKGKISGEGAFRQWNNANLQALLEPTESGERLRLRTVKGNARTFQGMGAAFMSASLVIGVMSVLGLVADPSQAVTFGLMGAAFFLVSRVTVPAWAKTRARQFEDVIERVTHSVEAAPSGSNRLPPPPPEGASGS